MANAAKHPEIHRIKSTIGGYVRRGNHEAADEARRDLRAARMEEAARDLVADWPMLTATQRDEIAAILRPAVADRGAA